MNLDSHSFQDKTYVVMGVANKKSVAYAIAQNLERQGARIIYTVHSQERQTSLSDLLQGKTVIVCDVEQVDGFQALTAYVSALAYPIDGLVHSIAFANYADGLQPFYQTKREDFLQAVQISAFSLVEAARALQPYFNTDASVVTISISSTEVTAENYGYMSPIKASLEGCVRFLAKSFSHHSRVRFNSVKAGPLKTKASAGIPGFLDQYLYSEKLTFRKAAITTQEVAQVALFLLSHQSSGMNGQGLVVDAGLGLNFFDQNIIDAIS